MTSNINDGGSAFPLPVSVGLDGHETIAYPGMSLRDWLAGQVGVDDIEFPDMETAATWMGVKTPNQESYTEQLDFTFSLEAFMRYKKADAMILARKTGEREFLSISREDVEALLMGTPKEKFVSALVRMASWFEGRPVDIDRFPHATSSPMPSDQSPESQP